MTIQEMVTYTLYYRSLAYYWQFARFDAEYRGWIETALNLREHKLNTVIFSTN